ncbi:MAG: sulfate transporter subunit, partial [Gluconobacter oxydans]
VDPTFLSETASFVPKTTTFDVASLGGWSRLQKAHFSDAGIFDQIYSH